MKFARLIQQYKYDLSSNWDKCGNIGDCLQNIAVENLYKEFGISENNIIKINRDEISAYSGENAILLMQGWFGNMHNVFSLNISPQIVPLYIGFHLNDQNKCRERFIEENLHKKMYDSQPIGCRDRNTRDFLKSHGLEAYFSGCLTLTYPKRQKLDTQQKIFIVDVTPEVENIIPQYIKEKADRSVSHKYIYKQLPVTYEETLAFEQRAKEILEIYKKEAKLVITSKIHCAMPCIAMGIPVIFIHNQAKDVRFDVLRGIIQIYTPQLSFLIDWNPKPANIEDLKFAIKQNVFAKLNEYSKKYSIELENSYHYDKNAQKKLNKIIQKYNRRYLFLKNYLNLFYSLNNQIIRFKNYLKLQFITEKKVLLWGASQYLTDIINKFPISNHNIIGIVDKNPALKGKMLKKYKIFMPEEIQNLNTNKIYITIINNADARKKEIEQFLKEKQLDNIIIEKLF